MDRNYSHTFEEIASTGLSVEIAHTFCFVFFSLDAGIHVAVHYSRVLCSSQMLPFINPMSSVLS